MSPLGVVRHPGGTVSKYNASILVFQVVYCRGRCGQWFTSRNFAGTPSTGTMINPGAERRPRGQAKSELCRTHDKNGSELFAEYVYDFKRGESQRLARYREV